MLISNRRVETRSQQYYPTREAVESLQSEVHDLTVQTDRYRDQNLTSLALTTTAGIATLAGGALTLLDATRNFGLGLAGLGGATLIGGIGLCIHTNNQFQKSEAERLAVAGELFETRRAVSRESIRHMFQGR